jgi:transcriptional regulator with XRE-family HTH domain
MNASALGEIERGRGNLTIAGAARLAAALGVPLAALFEAAGTGDGEH